MDQGEDKAMVPEGREWEESRGHSPGHREMSRAKAVDPPCWCTSAALRTHQPIAPESPSGICTIQSLMNKLTGSLNWLLAEVERAAARKALKALWEVVLDCR